MTTPNEIFKQLEANLYELNLEGKKSVVMELTEFMSEGQLDNIIHGMRSKYCKGVKK